MDEYRTWSIQPEGKLNIDIPMAKYQQSGKVQLEWEWVRIANLHPEALDGILWTFLSTYGEVRDIQAETWSRLYR